MSPILVIAWIIVGVVASFLGRMLWGVNSKGGPVLDIILGIVGALISGILFVMVSDAKTLETSGIWSVVTALMGGTILIGLGQLIAGPTQTTAK